MFTLAHLSDVHLGPLPAPGPLQLLGKRAIGYLSWTLRRKGVHDNAIIDALCADIAANRPDHVALTGDIVNISLPGEFVQAAKWLERFGPGKWITLVPGNHDTYVDVDWQTGLSHWADYMTGDLASPGMRQEKGNGGFFPFVRQRRNVALVAVSSAVPAPWNKASGTVGPRQLAALGDILDNLYRKGFYRVVLVHHPPLPGLAKERKALTDASEMRTVLEDKGAELVLHGHNHQHMRTTLQTRTGPAHIIGTPSASAKKTGKKPAAAWYEYRIRRDNGKWLTGMTIHDYDEAGRTVRARPYFELD